MALLLSTHLATLKEDTLLSNDKDDILAAHASHRTIVDFAEWIKHVGEHNG